MENNMDLMMVVFALTMAITLVIITESPWGGLFVIPSLLISYFVSLFGNKATADEG